MCASVVSRSPFLLVTGITKLVLLLSAFNWLHYVEQFSCCNIIDLQCSVVKLTTQYMPVKHKLVHRYL